MAKNEATVKFKAETSEFREAIKQANSDMKSLRSEMVLNEAQFKNSGNAAEYLKSKEQILTQQLSANSQKQSALNSQLQIANSIYGSNSQEASRLASQLNAVKAQEQNLQSQLASVNHEISANESQTAKLTSTISRQEKELASLKQQYVEAALSSGKESEAAKSVENSIKDLNSKLTENKQRLFEAEKGADELTRQTGELSGATDSATKSFTLNEIAVGNLVYNVWGRAASMAKDLAKDVLDTGRAFESSMSDVAALSGSSAAELETLEAKAREMGATTTFSASQAADALGYMALAGWDTQSMIAGLPGVLALAQAGDMELAEASDLVTDYLSAFNMTAEDTTRMVDVLAYSQANANTTTEGLGEAFRACSANANAAGLDVETTSAAIAMMANQGLKGKLAGTALNAVMRDMTARMVDGSISIGENSVAVMDAEGNYRDFAAILADVEAATDGMGDAQRAAALQSTFTADSTKGLNLLLNAGSDSLADFRTQLYNCAGAAQNTADVMTDNLTGDVTEMQSAFEELQLKIYDGLEEPLRSAVQFITNDVLATFNEMDEGTARLIAVIALATAGVTAYNAVLKLNPKWLQAMTGALKTWKAGLIEATIELKGQTAAQRAHTIAMKAGAVATKALTAAMKTLGPVLVITAIVELAQAFARAVEKEEELRKATTGLKSASASLKSSIANARASVSDLAGASEGTASSMQSLDDAIYSVIENGAALADSITEIYQKAGADIGTLEAYRDVISEFGDGGKLSAEELANLEIAVEGVNEKCGTSYQVAGDAESGYYIMADGARVAKDEILKLADAQALQIRQSAAAQVQQEAYAKLQEAASVAAAATESYNEKLSAYNDLVDRASKGDAAAAQGVESAARAMLEAKNKADEANAAYQAQKDVCDLAADSQVGFKMAIDAGNDSLAAAVMQNDLLTASFNEAGIKSTELIEGLANMGVTAAEAASMTGEQAAVLAQNWGKSADDIARAFQAAGVEAPASFASAVEANAPQAIQAAVNLKTGAVSGVADTPSEFGKIGDASVADYVSVIQAGDAAPAGADLARTGKAGLESVSTEESGQDFTTGFVNGTGQVDIFGAMQQLATSALDSLKGLLGIASPAKKAMPIGRFFTRGVAVGAVEEIGAVEDAMEQVADAMYIDPSPAALGSPELPIRTYRVQWAASVPEMPGAYVAGGSGAYGAEIGAKLSGIEQAIERLDDGLGRKIADNAPQLTDRELRRIF